MQMRRSILALASVIFAFAASPTAAQTTFNFATGSTNGTTTTAAAPNLAFTSGAYSVTVAGYTFGDAASPPSLDGSNLSTLQSGALLSHSDRGIGVCLESGNDGGNGTGCTEVDTATDQTGPKGTPTPNEAMLLSFTGAPGFNITEAVLNIVNPTDTLGIFGVTANGSLDFLGFAGQSIATPTSGFTIISHTTENGGQYSIRFTPMLGSFSQYLFTTARATDDGYRLSSLTVISSVPEAEVWAMMIFGFGLIGFQMRRSKKLRVTTA